MFRALFVKDGVGVVDVDQHALAAGVAGKLFEQAAGAGKRQVTHFASGFLATAGLDEFVIAPEGAVEQQQVARGGIFGPFRIAAGKRSRYEHAFSALLESKAEGGFVFGKGAAEFVADVIRVRAAQRNGGANERRRFARSFGEMTAEPAFAGKALPLHRGIGTFEDAEDFV